MIYHLRDGNQIVLYHCFEDSLCREIILRVEKVYYYNFLKSRISALVHYKGTSEVFL